MDSHQPIPKREHLTGGSHRSRLKSADCHDYGAFLARWLLEDGQRNQTARFASTLQRLVIDGYLESDDKSPRKLSYRSKKSVYPTALALRMLPYFQDLPEAALLAELAKLHVQGMRQLTRTAS
jgi:hypothetical protein